MTQSCHKEQHACHAENRRPDILLWGSAIALAVLYALHAWFVTFNEWMWLQTASVAVYELMNAIWWGIALGVLMVALLSRIPREFVMSILGTNTGLRGILRATLAGVLLDLCNHGILMVGAKLYERGASTGQVMAFLIASPWNSFSLTLILLGLIGFGWTLVFIVLSMFVAVITGLLFDVLVRRGTLPENPRQSDLPQDFHFWREARKGLSETHFSVVLVRDLLIDGVKDSRMVVRWILFGVLLAALLRASIPPETFGSYFGPTLAGLGLTLLAATLMEVCSEGSTPIAADLLTRAEAPGNGFAFLMAGVATDYTEIMVLKETTKSWAIALFLPLLTVPQVIIIAWLLNQVPI